MFELATPWALIALPLPWIVWFLLPRAPMQLSSALKVPFFNAVAGIMDQQQHGLVKSARFGILFSIWILLLLASAGPRWVGAPKPIAHEGHNIMMALDLSGSMELDDMSYHGQPVSRLAVVKKAAVDFVKARTGDKIGLILFGSQAYLQTPLTTDRQNILNRLDDATVGLAGQTTSIGDALGLAIKRLEQVPAKGRIIILLTDGANNSGILAPLKAAELAHEDGIKIYTIGLGAEADMSALNQMLAGMNAGSDLDEDTLLAVAKMTGGQYFRATDMPSLQKIYQTINQLETVTQDQPMIRPQRDYYPWTLAIALGLFLYWVGRETSVWSTLRVRFRREITP